MGGICGDLYGLKKTILLSTVWLNPIGQKPSKEVWKSIKMLQTFWFYNNFSGFQNLSKKDKIYDRLMVLKTFEKVTNKKYLL